MILIQGAPRAQELPALTPGSLEAALAVPPEGAGADRLAEAVRSLFGGREALLKGSAAPRIDELTVAWALEVPGLPAGSPPPRVVSDVVHFNLPLTRIGTSDVYAGVARLAHGTAFSWHFEAGDRRLGGGQLEVYETHGDSRERPGVPKGTLTQMPPWESAIFAGTRRDWWVYVPAQYAAGTPAAVMVFQDGNSYREYVPIVFDNLIAKGDMPVTVGIFLQPGVHKDGRSNRSFEYDTLSDQYARFLLEEILPEVEKTTSLRKDAAGRAIAGASSGGICAFTVAWERPGEFSKVLSWIGSFTNIASGKTLREGGHNYEAMIRKTPKKPIRVFLQDGANDLDNANGNWPLANLTLAKSLAYARYDYRFEYGQGFHSHRHGRAILPDSLRWLWRGHQESGRATSSFQRPTPNSQLPTPNSQLPTPNSQLPTTNSQLPTPNAQRPTLTAERPIRCVNPPGPLRRLPCGFGSQGL
ncbi:MAG: enterochelin esterase [Acidobacteria bacterium]|nr:enterochelin esterase [Acidobacteriota bacterium]